MSELQETIARALCSEKCAFMGEPPCWQGDGAAWPNPACDDPGCHSEAAAVEAAVRERGAPSEAAVRNYR